MAPTVPELGDAAGRRREAVLPLRERAALEVARGGRARRVDLCRALDDAVDFVVREELDARRLKVKFLEARAVVTVCVFPLARAAGPVVQAAARAASAETRSEGRDVVGREERLTCRVTFRQRENCPINRADRRAPSCLERSVVSGGGGAPFFAAASARRRLRYSVLGPRTERRSWSHGPSAGRSGRPCPQCSPSDFDTEGYISTARIRWRSPARRRSAGSASTRADDPCSATNSSNCENHATSLDASTTVLDAADRANSAFLRCAWSTLP